jgi:septal ring factor EnvC (AmiA/AmiB activator)
LHWKHECGQKILSVAVALSLIGGFLSLPSYGFSKTGSTDDFDQRIEEKNLTLDSIRNELNKGREKLRQLQMEEGSHVLQLEQMERNIATAQQYMRRLDFRMDTVAQTISALGSELDGENIRLAIRQGEMKNRLRYIYKTGQSELPQIILTSRSVSDILHRVRYFESLHEYDRRLLSQIENTRTRIQGRKLSLEKTHAQLTRLKKEKEQEHGELVREQDSRKTLLESVRFQKAAYATMIKDLEAAQQELKNIVMMLESRRKKLRTAQEKGMLSSFEKRKGALPWPVEGRVVSDFGKVVHSVYKTVIMNTGIDISARKGEKVYCIASGKVAYVGWMRGFGKFTIVDHGGYYTTYAHMDEVTVEKDAEVKSGSVLGSIGDQGILGGTRLHFEIRKSSEALDPLEWLEDRGKK